MSDQYNSATPNVEALPLALEAERRPIVEIKDGEVFANSRDVAAFFGKEVKHVHEAIKNLVAKEPQLGLTNFRPNKIKDLSGEYIGHYDMDRDGFVLLAMGFTGDKALRFKMKYIAAFNAMEAELRRRPPIDPAKVLNDPAALRGLLLTYSEKVQTLEQHVSDLLPKADALQKIAESEGSFCVTDAAKTLQVQPKVLFGFLRSHRWMYTRPGSSQELAYQDKLASGYLEHKTTTITKSDGSEKSVTQVRVTPRGLVRLAQELPPVATPV